MKTILVAGLALGVGVALGRMFDGMPAAAAGGAGAAPCSALNGDVTGDGKVELLDAIVILSHKFLGEPKELVPLCAPPSGLPDTGQSACWSFVENQEWVEVPCAQASCAGQDGAYATGCPSDGTRFVDNEDGTVSDTCTDLAWQKDTADVDGDGQSTDQDGTTWCNALAYCENLSFAGHDDWRLPNVRELQSIVDY
jgi:hypothetical protein